jgi:hypothetical protein
VYEACACEMQAHVEAQLERIAPVTSS